MKGILFRQEMIRAVINGSKTQTRRLCGLREINKEPDEWRTAGTEDSMFCFDRITPDEWYLPIEPLYRIGEIVYIKEVWVAEKKYDNLKPSELPSNAYIHFVADGVGDYPLHIVLGKLRSPMFLPERLARYFIKITDVRVESLQEITEEDTYDEGIEKEEDIYFVAYMAGNLGYGTPFIAFQELWDSLNPQHKYDTNPWVWVYTFVKQEIRE